MNPTTPTPGQATGLWEEKSVPAASLGTSGQQCSSQNANPMNEARREGTSKEISILCRNGLMAVVVGQNSCEHHKAPCCQKPPPGEDFGERDEGKTFMGSAKYPSASWREAISNRCTRKGGMQPKLRVGRLHKCNRPCPKIRDWRALLDEAITEA